MVNKTKFYKTKVALAVVLSLGLAACGDSDGDVSTSNNTADASQPTEVKQVAKGSIQGVVLDTNGQPIVGATVTVSGKTTTTDASGSYKVDDLQVTNVAGADAGTAHIPFVVVIQSPEGYASTATVNVTPNAQIDAANNDSVGTPLTTFIDGFSAQAGTAILPKKDSVIEGWIRNVDTGEATEGAFLSIDYTGLSSTVAAGGANVAISGDLKTTTTDAEGYYRFEGAYNDAVYQIAIQDHIFVGSTTTTDTATDASAVEAYVQGAAGSRTIATTYKVKANTTPVVTVNGVQTAAFIILDGVITSNSAADIVAATDYVTVSYTHEVTTTTTTSPSGTQYGSTPTTTGEGVEINMGTQTVRMITSSDTIRPYVANVSGWIQSSASGYGILNEGVDTEFKIHFSEPVNAATFNVADVLVTDQNSTILPTVADGVVLAADGRSVTVTLAEAQDPGTKISIFIPWQDATDVAGNFFSVTANDDMDIDFDSQVTATSGKASYLRVNLCVFLPAVINPTGFEAVQYFDRTEDEDAGSDDLAAYSNAFLDNHNSQLDQATPAADLELRQLNGDDTDTASLLDDLGSLVSGTAITTDTDHAAVVVTKGQASSFTWSNATGTTSSDYGTRVWFNNVDHGDSVTFTYYNDLALAAGQVSVTLVDAIKPTTILQENYNLPGVGIYASKIVTTGELPTQGSGGEVTEVGVDATIGNPIIYVQPRHLTPTIAATNTASTVEAIEFDALTANVTSRSATTTETPQTFEDAGSTTDQPIYDDAAFAAWTAVSRANSMGVGFSEDVAMTTGGAPIFSGTGVTITNFTALNDVAKDIDGNALLTDSKDLVRSEVSDMVALANDNHNSTLSFSGDVEDIHANVADDASQAVVVFRDAMPPMVTAAQFNGSDVVITFNEALGSRSDLDSKSLIIDDLDTTVDGAAESLLLSSSATGTTLGAFSISADGKTLTVQTGTKSANISALFEAGQANEFAWNEVGNATLENHVALAWDEIPDSVGNQWSFFDADTLAPATPRYAVEAPRFYMFDNVGPFTYGVATAGYDEAPANVAGQDDNGDIVLTITFTHPIDLALGNAFSDAIDGADGIVTPNPITDLSYSTSTAAGAAVMNALFTMDLDDGGANNESFGTGVVSATNVNGSVTIDASHTVVTLTIDAADGAVLFDQGVGNDTSKFGFATTVTSAINGLQTTAGDFNWQKNN